MPGESSACSFRLSGLRRGRFAALVLFLAGCGGNMLPTPTDADVMRARHFAPTATVAELNEGRVLFADRCTSCHQLPAPSAYPAERWEHFVGEMRQQAALSAPQEQKVVLYLKVMASQRLEAERSEAESPEKRSAPTGMTANESQHSL